MRFGSSCVEDSSCSFASPSGSVSAQGLLEPSSEALAAQASAGGPHASDGCSEDAPPDAQHSADSLA